LFFAAVEEKRICFTQPAATVRGVPPAIVEALGQQTATWEGSLDLGAHVPGLEGKGTTGTIALLSLTVNSGADLRGIRSARLEVAGASGEQWQPALEYAPPETGAAADSLELDPIQQVDLFPIVHDGGQLRFRLTLTGSPPAADWGADLVTCMSADLKVDALKAL
jgi:hypothetical protein